VSIMEFRNGRIVNKTQYFRDLFELPAWPRQWVQQMARGRTEDEEICLTDSRPLGNWAHRKIAAIVTERLRPNAG
jgi:hypothetical protein